MGIRLTNRAGGLARGATAIGLCLVLANCASSKFESRIDPRYGVPSSPRVVGFDQPVPKGGGKYMVGKPYWVGGRLYIPSSDPNYHEVGWASWYGHDFRGRLTANGEVFDSDALTAANPVLPLPCYARVTNLENGRSLIVRVNDRGPYAANRIIDVSHKAAELLGFNNRGLARVKVAYVGRAPLRGSNDRLLMATLRTGAPAPAPSSIRLASARSFAPVGPSYGRPIRGEVPLPEGRPYSLGETSVASVSTDEAPSDTAVSNRARAASRALPHGNDRYVADLSPASAYAPVDPHVPSELLAGRGLY